VKLRKNVIILWFCVSCLFFQVLHSSATAEAGVTIKKPQVLSSPEENISVTEDTKSKKKSSGKMLWVLLGAALIGGVAAAAGGGGGGGGGGDDDPTPTGGGISGSW